MKTSAYSTYVEHLKRGELAFQYSPLAKETVFFPRAVSPFSVQDQLEWRVSKGLGTVYSTTSIAGRSGDYNVALIDCDEGFRLMSRVEGLPPDEVQIGMRVQFKVHTPDDPQEDPYPVFVPTGAPA